MLRAEERGDAGDAVLAQVEHVAPPGEAVTVYPVTTAPPFDAGATHDTVT